MIDITVWMNGFLQALNENFADRVWFVGLQGSYGRGEATEDSDIDMVVILDKLTAADIRAYNTMLDTLPHREKLCGFLSGKEEIVNWETSDLFQFYHDTTAIYGSLDELLPLFDSNSVERAVKIGACNIYHATVHNMLYEKSEDILRGLYKSACFVIQALCFLDTEKYISTQKELLLLASKEDAFILQTFMDLKQGGAVCFEEMSDSLFQWSKKLINHSKNH